jgi:hypothetical protein
MKKGLILALVLAFPSFAAGAEFTLKEIRYDKKKVYLFPNNGVAVTSLSCDAGAPFVLEEAQDGFKELYSMSLAALVSGRKMQCWFSKCTSSTWGGTRPQAYACGLLAQ